MWRQNVILFMTATEYVKKPDSVKSSYCYTVLVNEQGKYMFNSCELEGLQDEKLQLLIKNMHWILAVPIIILSLTGRY